MIKMVRNTMMTIIMMKMMIMLLTQTINQLTMIQTIKLMIGQLIALIIRFFLIQLIN